MSIDYHISYCIFVPISNVRTFNSIDENVIVYMFSHATKAASDIKTLSSFCIA